MKALVLIITLSGCVVKTERPPVYRYDYTESAGYDCPHSPDREQDRCSEGGDVPH